MSNFIGSKSITGTILKENNFHVKKKFGQNFLVDQNILTNITSVSGVNKKINVIEIGPGLGGLTEHLAEAANKVLCYEIDSDLLPILNNNLSRFDNVSIINDDVLKRNVNSDILEFLGTDLPVYLVANLPYYITTPIIIGLLEKTNLIKKYTMMMQLEVANRICSKPAVKDYNALSVVIQYKTIAKKVLDVPRTVFMPEPNVDSAVINLELFSEIPFKAVHEDFFYKFVRQCFVQRRKTLANNISLLGIKKDAIYPIIESLGLNKSVRSEVLNIEQFVKLSDKIYLLLDSSL